MHNIQFLKYFQPVNKPTPICVSDMFSYDPFGMGMEGRSWSAGSEYRYGFSGKERDSEIYGSSNLYTSFYRGYNPRLGNWLSTDPLYKKYSHLSPYSSFKNNPIYFIDLKGDDIEIYSADDNKKPILVIVTTEYQAKYTLPASYDYNGPSYEYKLEPTTADAFIISLDAGFSFGGGATVGISVGFINSGKDEGGVFIYRQGGGKIGFDLGVDLVAGDIDFKEDNSKGKKLTRESLEGKSQGASGSALVVTGTSVTAYVNGKYHTNPFKKEPEVLYEGVMVGVGIGGGGAYYFNNAVLMGTVVQPENKKNSQ